MTTVKAAEPIIMLETRDGGEVAKFECLAISLMKPCPDMVVWSERIFILNRKDAAKCVYREGFLFPLIDGATARRLL